MPNLASILKDEIARLARRELRSNTESLKKAVANYRGEIASLKRRIDQLERQQKRTQKVVRKAVQVEDPTASDEKYRWSATRFAAQRARLGLSATDYGALIGVSGQSVYKWESGHARPRERYMPAIASMRKMGKRE